MNGKESFEAWAGEHEWSDWTKPTLFANGFAVATTESGPEPEQLLAAARTTMATTRLRSMAGDGSRNCIVVDGPGEAAIALGALLAEQGFAPVVLFNGVTATRDPLIRNDGVVRALVSLRPRLVAENPSPAFLLDSRRNSGVPTPGKYDNRWLTFPQDFPSAGRLQVAGIKRCYLLADPPGVAEDLAHVLRRWQEAGIEIYDGSADPPRLLDIKKPLWFRQVFYRWVALTGFRPNSFGGFGAAVAQSRGTGYGGFG